MGLAEIEERARVKETTLRLAARVMLRPWARGRRGRLLQIRNCGRSRSCTKVGRAGALYKLDSPY